jgi:hypothetical protein
MAGNPEDVAFEIQIVCEGTGAKSELFECNTVELVEAGAPSVITSA